MYPTTAWSAVLCLSHVILADSSFPPLPLLILLFRPSAWLLAIWHFVPQLLGLSRFGSFSLLACTFEQTSSPISVPALFDLLHTPIFGIARRQPTYARLSPYRPLPTSALPSLSPLFLILVSCSRTQMSHIPLRTCPPTVDTSNCKGR